MPIVKAVNQAPQLDIILDQEEMPDIEIVLKKTGRTSPGTVFLTTKPLRLKAHTLDTLLEAMPREALMGPRSTAALRKARKYRSTLCETQKASRSLLSRWRKHTQDH